MYVVEEYKVSEEELINLLKSLLKLDKENEWIEFKLNNDDPSMIGEYISALSNSATLSNKEHAYLIYGVDDKSKEVIGTDFNFDNSKKGNEPLYNWLYRKLKPQIDFNAYEIYYSTDCVEWTNVDNDIIKSFYNGKIDGIEGVNTKKAYRSFQKFVGITVDGIYGRNTCASEI